MRTVYYVALKNVILGLAEDILMVLTPRHPILL